MVRELQISEDFILLSLSKSFDWIWCALKLLGNVMIF